MLRWVIFLAILGLVVAARRGMSPPADHADRADPIPVARTTPPVVEPRWTPPPQSPPATDDVDGGAPAVGMATPGASAAPASGEPSERPPRPRAGPTRAPRGENARGDTLVIEGLSLRDADGRTIYRGRIDLAPTLERIAEGQRLRFPNDGATFQNRERRLPGRPSGYYREWVVPTPGQPGPGPQRLVTGEDGDVWYTSDHYRSFRRIRTKADPR